MKGAIIIIGGNEDKGFGLNGEEGESMILDRIVSESRSGSKSRIELVTSATSSPKETGEEYLRVFKHLGASNVGWLNIDSREHAHEGKNLDRLEKADVIFVTGGDQLKLTSILGGTPFLKMMIKKLKSEPFIYAGTSAGAAAISPTMIIDGSSENAILKGEIRTAAGFSLLDNVVFDTHFISRGRIGRLFQIVVSNPEVLGVGLEENTGLLIRGDKMEAIGPGMTILLDGRHIKDSNLLDIRDGIPLSIDNFVLHVMSKTDVYNLKTRELKIVTPKECR